MQHIIWYGQAGSVALCRRPDKSNRGIHVIGQPDSPECSAVELISGLDETWTFIEACLSPLVPLTVPKLSRMKQRMARFMRSRAVG